MITIYTSPSCASCRKVKKWFEEQKIPYKEKNIFTSVLDKEELKKILELTENGTEDIISKRSNVIKENKIDIDSMSLNELFEFIKANPSCLKRPIIISEDRLRIGYNEEEISSFIPRAKRLAMWACSKENCEKYDNCDYIKGLEEEK